MNRTELPTNSEVSNTTPCLHFPNKRRLASTEDCTSTIYGIAAYADAEKDGAATILASVHDVTTDKQALDELVSLCNRLELSSVHLLDVVEDFLAG